MHPIDLMLLPCHRSKDPRRRTGDVPRGLPANPVARPPPAGRSLVALHGLSAANSLSAHDHKHLPETGVHSREPLPQTSDGSGEKPPR